MAPKIEWRLSSFISMRTVSPAFRNGVCGAPFDVVLFEDQGPDGSRKIAILFEGDSLCAVLDVAKLAASDIAFGSNSWRGDDYESALRQSLRPPNAITFNITTAKFNAG